MPPRVNIRTRDDKNKVTLSASSLILKHRDRDRESGTDNQENEDSEWETVDFQVVSYGHILKHNEVII